MFTKNLFLSFGAKYAGEKTGLIYSDTMDDFSTPGLVNSYGYEPSEANFIVPGKRPLSSMSPIIIVDNSNQVRLVLGASGGSKIITGVAQVTWIKSHLVVFSGLRYLFHICFRLLSNLFYSGKILKPLSMKGEFIINFYRRI